MEIGFVLLLTIVAVVLFVTEKFSTDIVAILVMVVLLVSRVLTPAEGLAGFANTATVTVGAMFVLSAGMFRSGAVNFVGRGLGRLARHSSGLMLFVLMVGVGVLSSFLNNTAAVAILIPVVIVVGSEGKGLSRLVTETCDQIVSIPISAATESLNAGIAASVALYQVATIRAASE